MGNGILSSSVWGTKSLEVLIFISEKKKKIALWFKKDQKCYSDLLLEYLLLTLWFAYIQQDCVRYLSSVEHIYFSGWGGSLRLKL